MELEVIEVSGGTRELGRQQGEVMRSRIRDFVAMRFDAVDQYLKERGSSARRKEIIAVAEKSARVFEHWDADGFSEHRGIAEGAGVESNRLYAATNMTDMRDVVLLGASSGPPLPRVVDEGCSSALVPAPMTRSGAPLAGQTWDLNPQDLDFVVAIHRRPEGQPETWAITCTGCLTIAGMNEHGVSVGTTNIKTYGAEPGVGYLGILHRAIRAKNAEVAAEIVRSAPHAGAHTYWIADATEMVEWEASPNGQYMRRAADDIVARTNHCLSAPHIQIEGEIPSSSSKRRLERVRTLLAQGEVTIASMKVMFSNRDDGVDSINRYPEDDQGTATNAVLIADPASRTLSACRGPADRGTWLTFSFKRS